MKFISFKHNKQNKFGIINNNKITDLTGKVSNSNTLKDLIQNQGIEEAKSYEKEATASGSPFTWSEGESLDEMMKPERVKQIREDHEKRINRMNSKNQINPLRPNDEPIDIDAYKHF